MDTILDRLDDPRRGITFGPPDGGDFWSFAALRDAGTRMAGALAHAGVEPGDRVGVVLANEHPYCVAILGTWLAGATVVSLPPPPRRGPALDLYAARMTRFCHRLGCKVVFAAKRFRSAVPGFPSADPGEWVLRRHPPLEERMAGTALVQFTSGSTGDQKGVAISSARLEAHLFAIADHLGLDKEHDVAVSWLPLFHDMGLIGFLLEPLATQVPTTLLTPDTFVRNPRSWLGHCASVGATITAAPDFAYRVASRALGQASGIGSLGPLRHCLSGAERVSAETLTRFADAAAPFGLAWESLMPVYGMAEGTLAVTMPPVGRGPVAVGEDLVSVGPPLPGAEVDVDAPTGERGPVSVRTPWLLDGYERDAGFDAHPADAWLRTNDLGFMHDGELVVVGRTDHVMVVRGRNICAEDLESVARLAAGAEVGVVAAFATPDGAAPFGLIVELMAPRDADAAVVARQIREAVVGGLGVGVSPVMVGRLRTIPTTTSGKPARHRCAELDRIGGWPEDRLLAALD